MICPEGKGTFGKSTDKLKACRKCSLWDECDDEQQGR